MKKSTFSMSSSESLQLKKIMFITVLTVMLGTTSSFGSVKNNPSQKTEVVKKQDKNCNCKTCKDLQKKQSQKKNDKQCTCSNCKKQQKQTYKQKPTQQTWRSNCTKYPTPTVRSGMHK